MPRLGLWTAALFIHCLFAIPALAQSLCSNVTLANLTVGPTWLASPQDYTGALLPQDPATIEQVRNTLGLYPLCIDGKDMDSLGLVFTQDAVANYSADLGVLSGLDNIISTLNASLQHVTTQHSLTTQVIELVQGGCAARSLSYFRAVHFGHGAYDGQILEAYGRYSDLLINGIDGWRIQQRTLVFMGPYHGNLSVFVGS